MTRKILIFFLSIFPAVGWSQISDSSAYNRQILYTNETTGDTIPIYTIDDRTNIDSLKLAVEILNANIKDKEWEYVIEYRICSKPLIVKEYKFHFNKDNSSGTTIYGDELRRSPIR